MDITHTTKDGICPEQHLHLFSGVTFRKGDLNEGSGDDPRWMRRIGVLHQRLKFLDRSLDVKGAIFGSGSLRLDDFDGLGENAQRRSSRLNLGHGRLSRHVRAKGWVDDLFDG